MNFYMIQNYKNFLTKNYSRLSPQLLKKKEYGLKNFYFEYLVNNSKSFFEISLVDCTNHDHVLLGSLSLKASNFLLRDSSMTTGSLKYNLCFW